MHARSIERPLPSFNARPLVAALLLLAARVEAVDVPGSAGRLTVGGYLDGLAVGDTGGGPRQQPGALLALRLDARPVSSLRGHLELRGRVGGPFEGGHAGIFNLVHEFQNRSTSLEVSEAYVDVLLRRADVRVGVQKVAWGKLDGGPPTDVVNPRDYHDPIVQDFEERKIGVPAVLGSYYLPDVPRLDVASLRASLMYVPIAVPARLALAEERWFPSSIAAASSVTIPCALFDPTVALILCRQGPPGHRVRIANLRIPVAFRTLNNRPPAELDAGAVALRLGGTWRDMDWDLYHYTGPETAPDAELVSTTFLDKSRDPPRLHSKTFLRQAHDVIHMTGGDWSAALGGATLRAEAAVFQDRPYPRVASDLFSLQALSQPPLSALRGTRFAGRLLKHPQPVPLGDLFVDRDSVEWGVGADYLVHGFLPLVQVNQIALLEPAPRLLIADPETRLTASVRKPLLGDRLELEVRGTYAIERESWLVFPRASYLIRDDLRVRLGYLAIGGPRASIIGQFRDNDEVVMQARWSF